MRATRLLIGVIAIAACSNSSKLEGSGSGGGSETAVGSGGGPLASMPRVQRYTPDQPRMTSPQIDLPKQEAFTVIDAGKGAKTQLRYALADGQVEHRVETKLQTRQLDGGKLTAPIAIPALRDGFAIIIAKDQPLQLRPLQSETGAGNAALADQYLASWKSLLQNRRVAVGIDARGQVSTIRFNDDPANQRSQRAKDELVQRLLGVVVPLPEPAIGIGAKWQVITILRHGPAYLKQTATYTLGERTPASWRIHVKLLRVGEEQIVDDPTLPAGGRAELLALFRQLEGDVTIDPKRPLVAGGSYSVESRTHVRVALPGQAPIEQFVEDTGAIAFTSSQLSP